MNRWIKKLLWGRVGSKGLGKAWWTRFGFKIIIVQLGFFEPPLPPEKSRVSDPSLILDSLFYLSPQPPNVDPEPRMNSDKWIKSRKLRGPSQGGSNKYQKTKSRCWQSFLCPKSYLHKFPKQSPSSFYTPMTRFSLGKGLELVSSVK
jgi:hypothetical protein